ncbi:tyrosine-type recombinase/integrase [Pseudohoeflea coraliihabitans]|uniref:Site-specific integrase n=1 Tax=Pseudohoeflea coraliihabitans TaxID=2860393 RepID=A0ABS6WMH6_9HYPH|nr:site-specific integrase [Pseudohoeflea sp. DP4N28-3]MBW3096858.1 site-specific integrase [Pseudohoeflea sp. DP4N28-3]
MSNPRKPPRLWQRPGREQLYIKDGGKRIATGCAPGDPQAEIILAEYIARKYEAPRGGRAHQVTIADVLLVYTSERVDSLSRPGEARAMIIRLNEFMGDKPVSEIKGRLCRAYAKHRISASGARRDLETLRAALRYYHREYGLDVLPVVTLPDKSLPRERWLTRKEVAALIRAARRQDKCEHMVRLILIGLYTGTRLTAMLNLQWMANTEGGWIDLDAGILYRKATGERVAHNKRKTPVRIPPRLMRFLKSWKASDKGLRHVIHFRGAPIAKPHKAFRTVRRSAGLGEDVTPHILRHTRGTWLAQKGVPAGEAAASLGLTVAEYERTYLHNDPAYQEGAANAF